MRPVNPSRLRPPAADRNDDQAAEWLEDKERVLKGRFISGVLEVKQPRRRIGGRSDCAGQCRFATLAWPEQSDGRCSPQPLMHQVFQPQTR